MTRLRALQTAASIVTTVDALRMSAINKLSPVAWANTIDELSSVSDTGKLVATSIGILFPYAELPTNLITLTAMSVNQLNQELDLLFDLGYLEYSPNHNLLLSVPMASYFPTNGGSTWFH